MTPAALADISVFERGWLSSNNVLLHDVPGGASAVLVDSSHVLHGAQTVALLRHALQGRPLAGVVNTHLHSDHCGGNALLQRSFGCRVTVPPGQWDALLRWDTDALSYAATGQQCERFTPDARIAPGDVLRVGTRQWQALAAPGHDPHSLIFFDAAHGVVITADALWERGFGVVFPELEGEHAFDDVARVLELIDSLGARIAIPGHGAPFDDIAGALQRAHARLAGFRAEPARHARHAIKVLIKYHLLEEQQQAWPAFVAWLHGASLVGDVWLRLQRPCGSLAAFAEELVLQMADSGALSVRDGVVCNA